MIVRLNFIGIVVIPRNSAPGKLSVNTMTNTMKQGTYNEICTVHFVLEFNDGMRTVNFLRCQLVVTRANLRSQLFAVNFNASMAGPLERTSCDESWKIIYVTRSA